MYSINFPDMLSSASTNLSKDYNATAKNLRLLLGSWKGSLFGDPYFGTNLKRILFEQNNIILYDIIIDELYVAIEEFIPQVYLTRKDITLTRDKDTLYCTINCINKIDNQPNTYRINLM